MEQWTKVEIEKTLQELYNEREAYHKRFTDFRNEQEDTARWIAKTEQILQNTYDEELIDLHMKYLQKAHESRAFLERSLKSLEKSFKKLEILIRHYEEDLKEFA